MNAQEKENSSNSSDKIVEREHIENTPFTIITLEKGSFIAIGNKRVTEYTTKQECKNLIFERDWDLIANMVMAMYATMTEMINKD